MLVVSGYILHSRTTAANKRVVTILIIPGISAITVGLYTTGFIGRIAVPACPSVRMSVHRYCSNRPILHCVPGRVEWDTIDSRPAST